jgi:hypothetical protein
MTRVVCRVERVGIPALIISAAVTRASSVATAGCGSAVTTNPNDRSRQETRHIMSAGINFMVELIWSRLQSASTSMRNLHSRSQRLSSCLYSLRASMDMCE